MDRLTLIVIILMILQQRRTAHPITSTLYSCDPSFDIESLIFRTGSFESLFLMTPTQFIEDIASRMIPQVKMPKNADHSLDLRQIPRLQRSQLNQMNRICRMILGFRSVPFLILSEIYDQSLSTTYADFHHCAQVMVKTLAPIFLAPIIPHSNEYYDKMSSRGFRFFNRCLYAYDIVKFKIRTPITLDHNIYFDGHAHEYNVGVGLGCDCDGIVRIWNGPYCGSMADLTVWRHSDYHQNPGYYFAANDRILGDGSFNTDPRFITPVSHLHRALTRPEQRYNDLQKWSRSQIENVNSRIRQYCPIVNYLHFHLKNLPHIIVAALIMTNIRMRYKPLRAL